MSRPVTIIDDLDADALLELTGWHLEPRGACRGAVCVPVSEAAKSDPEALAGALGIGLARDADRGLWAIGPDARQHALQDATLPDLVLPSRHGDAVPLRSLIGRRGVLVAWASW